MKILITGATGMIGHALVKALNEQYDLTLLGRSAGKLKKHFKDHCLVTWGDLNAELMSEHDVVINLAGENIGAGRWNAKRKARILTSRIDATERVASLCATLGKNSPRLLNASAIGVYGIPNSIEKQITTWFDESSPLPNPPKDYLSVIGQRWESSLEPAERAGASVIKLRFAVVLSPKGGALKKLLPGFWFGMGAVIGTGSQPFSWITLSDLVSAVSFLIKHPRANGPYNLVADEVVDQRTFAKTLAAVMHRPCWMVLPEKIIQMIFGQMGDELLLNGQQVKNSRLKELGFEFQYGQLEKALNHLLERD